MTAFARGIGDRVTTPGGRSDTTTPAAMAGTLERLAFGDVLAPRSRARLTSWMRACRTGTTLLRAGLPRSWRAGDKSGSGGSTNAAGASDTRNDVAVAWPPSGAPAVVVAYLTGSTLAARERDAILAGVGRVVAAALTPAPG